MVQVERLAPYLQKQSIRAETISDFEKLPVLGVSNKLGISETDHKKSKDLSKYQLIEAGNFAYNPYRINVGSIGLVPYGVKGLVSPAYVVFATNEKLLSDLLFDFLKSNDGLFQIGKYARGTVRKALRFEDLCQIEMPIPPLDKQQDILKKKISIQSEVNILEAELTHQQTLLKKLRQQILQEAIEGKLTADWRAENPDVEPAGELLERIKIKKQKALPPITDEEKPFDLPGGWEWCRLGDTLEHLLGGYAFKSPLFKKLGDKQVLRLGNIRPYRLRLDEKPVFIEKDVAKNGAKAKLKINDLLITMTGTRGKRDYCYSVLLTDEHFRERELYLNQRVGCFRFNHNIYPRYYDYSLKSEVLLDSIFDSSTGAANQANIGSTALKSWVVPLPPLLEQKAIVAKVETLLAICDQLESQITNNQTYAEQLMQAVLKEAFQHASSLEEAI